MLKTRESQVVLTGPDGEALIRKTPGVCGGSACIRMFRVPVWQLVEARRLVKSDHDLLKSSGVPLTLADVAAAWEYAAKNPTEIAVDLWQNEAVMFDQEREPIAGWFLVRGRQLGLTDEEIRDSFYPALLQVDLDAAWRDYQQNPEPMNEAIRQYASR